ncbi:MAG: substrate-binding domain-containing protein [Planctomycetota bacterium]
MRMVRASSSVFCVSVTAACLLAACGDGGGKKARFLIGFSQCNLAEPWRQAMNDDALREAANYKDLIEVEFQDANNDDATQVSQLRTFIRKGVDLIIVSPRTKQPCVEPVKEAIVRGIPVIVLDRDLETEAYTCFIGAPNYDIGKAAGNYIVEVLGGRGKVLEIQGLLASVPAEERRNGFRDAIRDHPGIEVIDAPEGRWLREEGQKKMEVALQAHEEIDLVYAHNDPMAIGAYLAAEAKGRDDDILFVGIDGLPGEDDGPKAVLDGHLSATFLYPTCGKEAIATAVKILKGEPAPKKIALETALITKENAALYYRPKAR